MIGKQQTHFKIYSTHRRLPETELGLGLIERQEKRIARSFAYIISTFETKISNFI